jgi:hypothetical protein
MRKKSLLACLLLILFLSLTVSAQTYDQGSDTPWAISGLSDRELLPGDENAWVIHLFTTGGLTGRGLPAVTIVSDSSYVCGDIIASHFKKLPAEQLAELSTLINSAHLRPTKSMDKAPDRPPIVCNDCYVTNVVVTRREIGKKVRTYQDDIKSTRYKAIAEAFENLRAKLQQMKLCN